MMKPLTMNDLVINNLEFAQTQQTLAGEIDVLKCERLAESLVPKSQGAHINFKLVGAAKQLRNPSLHLYIEAKLAVTCQRCLDEMLVNIHLNFNYIICNALPTEIDENDDTDWLEASL